MRVSWSRPWLGLVLLTLVIWQPKALAGDPQALVAAEYFWDNDPGTGNGTPLSVTAGESFTLGVPGTNLFNVNVSSLPLVCTSWVCA